jgi:DNA-binding NarL/FixJ family response regulator
VQWVSVMLTNHQPDLARDRAEPTTAWYSPSDSGVATAIIGRASEGSAGGRPGPGALGDIWEEFARGALRVTGSYAVGDRLVLLAREGATAERAPLTPTEARVITRVLCGEQQKGIAADLSIAPSTASHRFSAALRKLGVFDCPVPLPLIIAAEQASGVGAEFAAQCLRLDHEGHACTVVSVRRPDMRSVYALTRAEQEVACLFIEGRSRSDIAHARGTSTLTVAGQVHSIFATLRLSGRYALIRRAGEIGCFRYEEGNG